mgnify:CR=1 FL=1|jgi:hypothetical protein|tara:strand:- start:34124 stop:34591 length:468 start_codon:yes stop_codon:yes gene_type:complete
MELELKCKCQLKYIFKTLSEYNEEIKEHIYKKKGEKWYDKDVIGFENYTWDVENEYFTIPDWDMDCFYHSKSKWGNPLTTDYDVKVKAFKCPICEHLNVITMPKITFNTIHEDQEHAYKCYLEKRQRIGNEKDLWECIASIFKKTKSDEREDFLK